MKKILISTIAVIMATFFAFGINSPVLAENQLTKEACANADADQKAALGCSQDNTAPSVAQNLINAIISVLAIVSVIIIIVAGQRYLVAQGDPGQLKQAKDMILYAVIGLIIAGLAFAIVNFILTTTTGT